MDIVKDLNYHNKLIVDLHVVYGAFNTVNTRICEKALDSLTDEVCGEIYNNLTEDGAKEVERLTQLNPDSDIEWVADFLIFKHSVKVETTKDFKLRVPDIAQDIDENVCFEVRVYPGDMYIEHVDYKGRTFHMLTLENLGWSEPETSLEAMEIELYNFTLIGG